MKLCTVVMRSAILGNDLKGGTVLKMDKMVTLDSGEIFIV